MEEIIIQFAGKINLILKGEILKGNPIGEYPSWRFHLWDVDNDNISIPMSSDEIQDTTVTLNIVGDIKTPTFWSISQLDNGKDNFVITIYPNRIRLLKRNNKYRT